MKDQTYQIQLLNKIAAVGTDRFDLNRIAFGDDVAQPDAVMVRSADMHAFPLDDNLLCIARAGIGVNNIPVEQCSEQGIAVFNTPGANANAVKELVVCALLLASRDIIGGIEWAKSLRGTEGVAAAVEKGKAKFVGPELKNKSLGVIGLGSTGAIIANIAYRLGMDVKGCDPGLTVDNAWMINRLIHRAADRNEIFRTCDYITLHVPVTPQTKHMINAETIAQMKDGVRIVNLSRADIVDDAAMASALASGKVAKYVTDFPNEQTLEMPNTVCIPHLGASTPESEDNCAVMAADEIQNYLLYGTIANSVNLPAVDMPMDAPYRLFVIHKNVPHMLTKISSMISDAGLNIEHLLNRSKGDYAVTIADTGVELPEAVAAKILAMQDILRVRLIRR